MHLPELASWHWSPVLWLAGGLLIGLHWRLTRYHITVKTFLFATGIILAEIALALPMGPAPAQPLFSMHMIRHILLLMLAPPFLVGGLPKEAVQNLLSKPHVRKAGILLRPIVTWPLGVGIMWFWHAPFIFNRMMLYAGTGWLPFLLHIAEISSLLAVGVLFCSPIVFPLDEYRLPPLKGVAYLFTACVGCSILGILITFSAPGLYHTVFSSGVATAWGITQQTDQQMGGLLMWVPGCIIYVSGAMYLLIRWLSRAEPAARSTSRQTVTT